ncbi:6-phosphogluconolactonase [Prolixibacteraceae bacterium JC049]|nr:6-phosphogluconolactonase [Prolixibacteraceae bacterium JC049]
MKVETTIKPSAITIAEAFIEFWIKELEETKGDFHVALSGGSTPKLLFQLIKEDHLDRFPWERIHFWWGDERMVPPNDDDSNFKWAFELLIRHTNFPMKNLHRILGEMPSDTECLRFAAEMITKMPVENGAPVFDLVILGMGIDGHTASIFPDRLELFKSEEVSALVNHPESGQQRVTLTGLTINNARNIAFLVTGKSKTDRVSEIINNEEVAKNYPASYVKPTHGKLTWWLDKAAAKKI